jgi:hypothetical protein
VKQNRTGKALRECVFVEYHSGFQLPLNQQISGFSSSRISRKLMFQRQANQKNMPRRSSCLSKRSSFPSLHLFILNFDVGSFFFTKFAFVSSCWNPFHFSLIHTKPTITMKLCLFIFVSSCAATHAFVPRTFVRGGSNR